MRNVLCVTCVQVDGTLTLDVDFVPGQQQQQQQQGEGPVVKSAFAALIAEEEEEEEEEEEDRWVLQLHFQRRFQ